MSVQAWYEVGQSAPIPLDGIAQVDSVLDRITAEAAEAGVPVAAVLEWPDPENRAVLQFGVRSTGLTGFVGHTVKTGSVVSTNGAPGGSTVVYDYQGHETPVDASAEIDLPAVRRAVRHFVVSQGARDETITWRPLD